CAWHMPAGGRRGATFRRTRLGRALVPVECDIATFTVAVGTRDKGKQSMTLMEAVVALVILSLVGVGCLELAQGASRLEYSASQWNAVVTAAESRMAQVMVNAPQGS